MPETEARTRDTVTHVTTSDYVTAVEAAGRLRIETADVYRMIDAGQISGARNNRGRVVVPAAELDSLPPDDC